MATYSIGDLSRREILRMSAILGVTSVVSTKFAFAQAALQRTPGQILGPFYPMKPFDQGDSCCDEDCPHDQCAQDPIKQDTMMKLKGNPEIPEYEHENKHVVE